MVIALVSQLTQHTEQSASFAEQSARHDERGALVTAENARLQKVNAAHVQRVSDLERRLGLNTGNSSKPPSSDNLAGFNPQNHPFSGIKPSIPMGFAKCSQKMEFPFLPDSGLDTNERMSCTLLRVARLIYSE